MGFRQATRVTAPVAALLLWMLPASSGRAADAGISLPEAVRQALEANLELVSRLQGLAADREQIGLARSALLPQVGIGARAQVLDNKRSDSLRGNNLSESVLLAAGLNQVIYDEDSWAGFQTQKHIYAGQVQSFEAFKLGVAQDAADSFLELDRSQSVLQIQERNRELTRRNRETSRVRIAAGWSSDREVLRWDTQLAGNDSDVRAAQVLVLQNRFELNRARNLPPEEAVSALPATVEDYGFVYSRQPIAEAVVSPEADRQMRDFLTRVGLRRSPDLAGLDADIAAAERQLVAGRRAFWVPSLNLAAGVDYLANSTSSGDFNQTEWGLKGELSFPLIQGGAKFAGLEQARAVLGSLRTERTATAQVVERTIRSTLAQASGSFESVGFSSRQLAAARRNFELVDASYTLGVATILDLLDAQAQLLTAELSLTNIIYGFLQDLVAAERALSFYAFLEPPADVEALLDSLTRALGLQP